MYFKPIRGGLIWEGGGIFNLETTMVSVLPKEVEYKVEKLKDKKFYGMQPRIRIKSGLHLSVKNNNNFLPLKRGGGGDVLEGGGA